jgi:poly(A) polymerase
MPEPRARERPSISPRQAAAEIAAQLAAAGHVAYFAGGCVRDELLGLSPTDYDIATSASTEQIRRVFPAARGVGESFGVMLVRHRGHVVEVASFRTDGVYADGRRPADTAPGDERSDALRRDFTVNGLFMHPVTGAVIDHVDGRADIAARVLRAIRDPDARLSEDRLRLLRAVRFASRHGLTIEPRTREAIRAHAGELRGVSRERVGQELRRMLAHASRVTAIEMIEALGLAPSALLESAPPSPLSRVRALSSSASQAAALAAWLLDRASALPWPQRVWNWAAALVLSNKERDEVEATLRLHEGLADWPTLAKARKKRMAAERSFLDALAVLEAESPHAAELIRRECQGLELEGLAPAPLLGGDDLIALGVPAGPAFRRILEAVYDAQLEGAIASREAAIAMARQLSAS